MAKYHEQDGKPSRNIDMNEAFLSPRGRRLYPGPGRRVVFLAPICFCVHV
jgi:hypothetical protein